MMETFTPLEEADFSKVEVREGRPCCKIHGAMNCVSPKGYYRCVGVYKVIGHVGDRARKFIDNTCDAGCVKNLEDKDVR